MRWLLHLAFAWELFCLAVKNILLCVLGTVGFCVVLNVPQNKIFSVIIGAFVCSLTFEMLFEYTSLGIFACTLTSVVVAHTYSEIAARILKTPSTVILIPSTVPLLPGGYLFYAFIHFIIADMYFHLGIICADSCPDPHSFSLSANMQLFNLCSSELFALM